jgi:hypothetical protein
MGELLKAYLGNSRKASHAFWVGASRVIDPHPIADGDLVVRVLNSFGDEPEDDWGTVAEELREAISDREHR